MSNIYNKPVDEMTEDEKFLRDDLISQTAGLVHTISEFYGPEKGMRLWEDISCNMQDLRNDVFMAMISGTVHNSKTVILRGFIGSAVHNGPPVPVNSLHTIHHQLGNTYAITGPNFNKVEAIKAVRAVTGYGLKESKDCVDALSVAPVKIEVPQPSGKPAALKILRMAGINAL